MESIERPTASSVNVNELFGNKIFRVPDYQRSYAWERQNREDFWSDLKDGLETRSPHYWGTITLRDTGQTLFDSTTATDFNVFEVIDGQQRLVTLYLLFLALAGLGRPALRERFVKGGDVHRVEAGELNRDFLKALVDGNDPQPDLTTNLRLRETLRYFEEQVKADGRIDEITRYLQTSTFALEFRLKDENLAIKAFETLNDRGKPLSLLEKSKSFLRFCSSRYLQGGCNDTIASAFAETFRDYDLLVDRAEKANVAYISKSFGEDELLRSSYHYLARELSERLQLTSRPYDFAVSSAQVFDVFLKGGCRELRQRAKSDLKVLVEDFARGLQRFTRALREVVDRAQRNSEERRLLTFLGLSADVYPLLVSLEAEGLLTPSLLEAIEVLDLRVYKVRGTGPRAALYRDTVSLIKVQRDEAAALRGIRTFVETFMNDSEFETYLTHPLYGNAATKFILWQWEGVQSKASRAEFDEWNYPVYADAQVDHVFPKIPTFTFPGDGFENEPAYVEERDRIGNLTLLEERLNEGEHNNSPRFKARTYRYKSNFNATRDLGVKIETMGFQREDLRSRTADFVSFCKKRWPMPRDPSSVG